jgi:hypothetical protein
MNETERYLELLGRMRSEGFWVQNEITVDENDCPDSPKTAAVR